LAWVDSIGDDGVDCSLYFGRCEMADRKIVAIRALERTNGRSSIVRSFRNTGYACTAEGAAGSLPKASDCERVV
tara:strand:+ start:666 stop:887 length:222 start_codon:yes stop_codon:yes gene_type:complete